MLSGASEKWLLTLITIFYYVPSSCFSTFPFPFCSFPFHSFALKLSLLLFVRLMNMFASCSKLLSLEYAVSYIKYKIATYVVKHNLREGPRNSSHCKAQKPSHIHSGFIQIGFVSLVVTPRFSMAQATVILSSRRTEFLFLIAEVHTCTSHKPSSSSMATCDM